MPVNETNSQASSGPSYGVFLSFRGQDTRHGFTDCLYHAMVDAGILVFRDDESLRVGEKISDELLQAIENSEIYIPIFSKNYAESHWCLEELAHMVDCNSKSENKTILPIFLDVEPDDVKLKTKLYSKALSKHRKKFFTKLYSKALSKHRKKFCTEAVESWKNALIEVGRIKGWNLKKDNGQGELIRSVIQTVSVKLKVAYQNVTEHLVGVDDLVEAIIQKLDVGSDGVRFLIIHGMGGVGKTTLAKVVFNKLSSSFDGCCFLADVRESSKGKDGLVNLQNKLLSKLLGHHSINEILDVNDGINKIRGALRNKKVLIILDDVDEKEQLKSLVENGSWFGLCSKIIVTTRDKSVLTEAPNVSTYEVCEMEFGHALKLFSRHAFNSDSPPNHRVYLSKKIINTLGRLPLSLEITGSSLRGKDGRLPLSLEITGSSLRGKDEELWNDTLKKLQKAPPKDVQKKLMITYEKLEDGEKEVFLDIACFFVNEGITCPSYMWDDCEYYPHVAIDVLLRMSLIKIIDNKTFWMHDQVRDLGREIVRRENFTNPYERSRVWNDDEAWSIMKEKEGSRKIKAMSLEYHGGFHGDDLTSDEVAPLRNLRFLRGEGDYLVGDFNNLLPSLKMLSWKFWLDQFKATNFHPANLVILDLSRSNISARWIGWEQLREAKKLKVLNLSSCRHLERTPNLSTLVYLERLILDGCINLIEIDPSIGNLRSLLTFDLPNRKISKLPYSIGGLVKIRRLDLSECTEMKELPDSIGELRSLVELDLSLTSIGHLPDSIGNLKQLKVLRMRRIRGITELPRAIGLLEKLEELNARGCQDLTGEIPKEIGRLSRLRILDLSSTPICGLPATVSHLSNIQELKLENCAKLKQLPELPPSSSFLIWGYKYFPAPWVERGAPSQQETPVITLPDSVGRLQSLVELDLSWTSIGRLPDSIGNLKQLKVLRMCQIRGITELPRAIGLLEKLEELNARGCENLTGEIPKEIGRVSRLRILDLSSTPICGLPATVSNLSNLQTLELENCAELKQLPELPPSLSFLTWGCEDEFCPWVEIGAPSQQEIPVSTLPTNIGSLSQLKTLTLHCKNVQFLPQLPSSLRQLNFRGLVTTGSPDYDNLCHSLVTTRSLDFSNLKDLSFLTFHGCSLELSRIFDAESERLHMDYCKFRVVDAPLEMKRLRTLKMNNCMLLPEVLDLSRKKLDLSHMKNLEEVELTYCEQLVEICGLEELGSLCSLTVKHCNWLKTMSDLSKFKKLPKLDVGGNWNLNKQEIYWNYWNGEFGGDICNVGGLDLSSVPDNRKANVFFGSHYTGSDSYNAEETFGLTNLTAAHKLLMMSSLK